MREMLLISMRQLRKSAYSSESCHFLHHWISASCHFLHHWKPALCHLLFLAGAKQSDAGSTTVLATPTPPTAASALAQALRAQKDAPSLQAPARPASQSQPNTVQSPTQPSSASAHDAEAGARQQSRQV